MILISFVRISVLIVLAVDGTVLEIKPQIRRQHNRNIVCYNVTTKPFYLKTLVVGKPWHAYYAWNMEFKDMCLKTIFKTPNNMNQIVKFLKYKFYGLYEEPRWLKAELLMYMGDCKEMVLFRDRSGVPGHFDGLPYYKRDDYPNEIPLRKPFKLTMKVIKGVEKNSKYLFVSDCTSGITFLLLHPEQRPKRVEIEAFAAKFNFGDPYPACIKEPDPVIKNVTIEVITQESTTQNVAKNFSKYDW